MTYVLFDIGTHSPRQSLDRARHDLEVVCYAFEPLPCRANELYSTSLSIRDRYFINQMAISDINGFTKSDDKWAPKTIKIGRLDTWFDETHPPVNRIDFLNCDTGWDDFAVLRGLGWRIDLVREGEVRVVQQRTEMIEFLNGHGFFIDRRQHSVRFRR